MNFFDFAWSTMLQITKKPCDEVRILFHDELRYPYLGKDDRGFVLHVLLPQKINERQIHFQGLRFTLQNPAHKKMIWYLFKASIYHLSTHVTLSDFSIYRKWAQGKNPNLSTFVVSILEDAVVTGHLKRSYRAFLPEIAYANAISFARVKDAKRLANSVSRLMVSMLFNYSLGRIKQSLTDEMLTDVEAVTTILHKIEDNSAANEKWDAANKIYSAISAYGETFEIPSLLYTESHGTNDLFYESEIPDEESVQGLLKPALSFLEPKSAVEEIDRELQNLKESEAMQAFSAWQEQENARLKILKAYAEIGKDTKFDDFVFPVEDYTEYHRRRALLNSPIRRILHQLRLLKNVGGEDFRQESGFVDLQEAIQVIASKSQRTDIFARDELQTREDAWSILIDASHSLNMFKGEVRGTALCLAEVARTLILDQNSWGMYAFNTKFYIVKDFTERFNAHIRARIGGLSHDGLTYLPDAMLLAAQALKKRVEEARVLVVVSDFFPAGYEGAEELLKENIKKVERMGVGVIGIGVNSRAVKEYVRANCVVEGPYDLMKKFTKAFIEYSGD